MAASTVSFLTTTESVLHQVLGRKVELLRDASKDGYWMRFEEQNDYRSPAERAVDAAWERNPIYGQTN